jgi:hypothetical protein
MPAKRIVAAGAITRGLSRRGASDSDVIGLLTIGAGLPRCVYQPTLIIAPQFLSCGPPCSGNSFEKIVITSFGSQGGHITNARNRPLQQTVFMSDEQYIITLGLDIAKFSRLSLDNG